MTWKPNWAHGDRSAMRILDIAVADQEPVVRELVASLLAWLELICKQHFTLSDEKKISRALRRFWRALQPFKAIGISTNTPKLHRAADVFDVVKLYGGARHVSTDTYEMSHKALKSVMRRYVSTSLGTSP